MKKILLTVLLSGALSAHATELAPSDQISSNLAMEQVGLLVADAYALNKEAASMGFEWRDTVEFIKKAEEMAKNGKLTPALEAAKFAKYQAILSIRQANDQANAGPNY